MSTVRTTDGAMEQINGNLQIAAYAPRARGMKALEQYATTSMLVMNNLYDWSSSVKVKAGPIKGLCALYLRAINHMQMVNTSCAFIAQMD